MGLCENSHNRGRKPKPIQQQIIEGDPKHRGVHKLDATKAALPKAQRGLPDAPPHVTGLACEQWAIWKRDLELMQMHYSADAVMLVLLHVGLVHSVGKTPVNKRLLHWVVTEQELQH